MSRVEREVGGRGGGEDPPIIPRIVPARDVPERALARARLVALDEGDLLAQLVPELGVVFGFCASELEFGDQSRSCDMG